MVPLMAMVRHWANTGSTTPVRLLYSSRSAVDIIYREELERLSTGAPTLKVFHTLTRVRPAGWTGYDRRIDASMLQEVAWSACERPLAYVCGPTRFVESVASALVELGHDPARIRTERFGPTGL